MLWPSGGCEKRMTSFKRGVILAARNGDFKINQKHSFIIEMGSIQSGSGYSLYGLAHISIFREGMQRVLIRLFDAEFLGIKDILSRSGPNIQNFDRC